MSHQWPPQPPSDSTGRPAYGSGPPPGGYPRQQLSQQEVKPGRSRTPLYVALVVVLVLLVGGVGGYLLLRDTGEDRRAEYCTALRDVTNDGDLLSAFDSADSSTLGRLQHTADLAPDAVADSWKTLVDLVDSASASVPDVASAFQALTAVRAIVDDANSECGMSMQIPGF